MGLLETVLNVYEFRTKNEDMVCFRRGELERDIMKILAPKGGTSPVCISKIDDIEADTKGDFYFMVHLLSGAEQNSQRMDIVGSVRKAFSDKGGEVEYLGHYNFLVKAKTEIEF